jgi:quercetin dioxygenase-like cupin family protein
MNRPGFVIRPGEGDAVWSLGGRFTTKLAGKDADEQLALIEAVVWRGGEPPLHIHHREHEAWYVLEGQLTFHVGDAELVATAGSFAFAPKGVPHAFTVDVEPTRVLLVAAPAGFERFATELGVPAAGTTPPDDLEVPGPDVLGPVAERYGIEVIGPPLRVARGERSTT